MREPFLAWWPGTIPAGGRPRPRDDDGPVRHLDPARRRDAADRSRPRRPRPPARRSSATAPSPRDRVFYYRGTELYAVRLGPYKAHFITEDAYGSDRARTLHDPPVLYQLEVDPSERFDCSADHPDVLAAIRSVAAEHLATVEEVPNQLSPRIGGD